MHNSEMKKLIRECNMCMKHEIWMTVIIISSAANDKNSGCLDYHPLAATSTHWQDVSTKHQKTMQF